MGFAGFGAQPPYPRFWDDFHSDNAFKTGKDGKREIVTDTNNITQTADPALDPIIDQHRKAKTEEEVRELSWKLAKLIEERAAYHSRLGIPFLPLHDLALGAVAEKRQRAQKPRTAGCAHVLD